MQKSSVQQTIFLNMKNCPSKEVKIYWKLNKHHIRGREVKAEHASSLQCGAGLKAMVANSEKLVMGPCEDTYISTENWLNKSVLTLYSDQSLSHRGLSEVDDQNP